MNRTKLLQAILVLVVLAIVAGALPAGATRLYTQGNGDGYVQQDFAAGFDPVYSYVSHGSPIYVSTWFGEISGVPISSFTRGVVIMDISSLAGTTLAPGSVTLNFYSLGLVSGTTLQRLDYDPGATVESAFASGGWETQRTDIAVLSASSEEWESYDVTTSVQLGINGGHGYAGFVFSPPSNYSTGSLAGWSDSQGRGPYLDVAVPEPSGCLALLTGVGGLTGLTLRRKKLFWTER